MGVVFERDFSECTVGEKWGALTCRQVTWCGTKGMGIESTEETPILFGELIKVGVIPTRIKVRVNIRYYVGEGGSATLIFQPAFYFNENLLSPFRVITERKVSSSTPSCWYDYVTMTIERSSSGYVVKVDITGSFGLSSYEYTLNAMPNAVKLGLEIAATNGVTSGIMFTYARVEAEDPFTEMFEMVMMMMPMMMFIMFMTMAMVTIQRFMATMYTSY